MDCGFNECESKAHLAHLFVVSQALDLLYYSLQPAAMSTGTSSYKTPGKFSEFAELEALDAGCEKMTMYKIWTPSLSLTSLL
jgi:hypothetical protein